MTQHLPHPDFEKVKSNFARADGFGLDMQGLAAISNLSIDTVRAVIKTPGALEELEAEKLRAAADGTLMESKALAIVDKGMDRILLQIDQLDAFEVNDVLKMPMRVLEAAERRRAALRTDDNLPIFNIIVNGGGVSIECVKPAKDLIDVAAKRIDEDGEDSSWV